MLNGAIITVKNTRTDTGYYYCVDAAPQTNGLVDRHGVSLTWHSAPLKVNSKKKK